jgi:hypothetical protein
MLGLWLFHVVLKTPLLSLCPSDQQMRLAPVAARFRFGPSPQFILIILSLVLGACTHIAWDSFTHHHGWAVEHFTILQSPIMETTRGPLFVFNLLQRIGTLGGAALLIYWGRQWLKRAPARQLNLPLQMPELLKLKIVIHMAVIALILAGIYSYWKSPVFLSLHWHQTFARRFVLASILVANVELLIFSLGWHWTALKRRPSEAQ